MTELKDNLKEENASFAYVRVVSSFFLLSLSFPYPPIHLPPSTFPSLPPRYQSIASKINCTLLFTLFFAKLNILPLLFCVQKYANDTESTREKFIFIVWIGSGVKVMRKAKLSVHSADVKKVLNQFSIEVPANSKEDLAEVSLTTLFMSECL